jgi:hypothetical protein
MYSDDDDDAVVGKSIRVLLKISSLHGSYI